MRRGEIWWAQLLELSGRRPVVLVSRESAYAVRTSISVVEVSRTARGIPSEVPVGRREGLPRKSVLNTDNIVTIPKRWLQSRVGPLSRAKLDALDDALRFSLGLE